MDQLEIPSVVTASLADDARAWLQGLREGAIATGRTDEDLAADVGMDPGHLSRVFAGRAHPPARLIAYVLRHDRRRIHVRIACVIAEGEYQPKPPPSPAEELAAVRRVLSDMGLEDLVLYRARGGVKPASLQVVDGERP